MHSLVGLGLVYLATSWLLMWCVATYVHTRRDLQEHRRLAKSSSTGEALGGGFSSGSSAGSAADAAIEIHSTDSPMAAYKAASTVVLPRGAAGGVHHGAGQLFMMHNVAADVRGERDAAPRLPYV